MRIGARRLRGGLWALALGGAALAIVFRLLPASIPDALGSAVVPDSSGTSLPVPAMDASVAEDIAIASIFASNRTPPRSRYLPPESDSSGGFTVESNAMLPAEPSDSLAIAGEIPRLFGTVVDSGRGEMQALLRLSGVSGPRMYRIGDVDGGYRVVSIAPRLVVVRGPSGRVTLRLDPEENRP